MSLLSNLSVSDDIEVGTDTLGGGTNGPLESGIYPATVKAVYFKHSAGGALAANVHLDINGREIRQQLWIQSGDAKGNRNFYETKDGKKRYLPGFELFRSLTLMATNKEPNALDLTDGIMKLWDSAEGKEMPNEVPMARELTGAELQVGMFKQTVDKTMKADDGSYVPTGETRDENEIDKFFDMASGRTLVEAMAGLDAKHINDWTAKWEGVTRDRTSKVQATTTAAAPAGFGAPANSPVPAPVKTLFGS